MESQKRISTFIGRNECRNAQSILLTSFDQHSYMNPSGHFSLPTCQPCTDLIVLIVKNVSISCLILVAVFCSSFSLKLLANHDKYVAVQPYKIESLY